MTMKRSGKFATRNRIRSFSYALNGIISLIKYEHNARIHLAAILCVVISGILLDIGPADWMFVVVAIGLVVSAELLNTAIERLADAVSPERSEKIRIVKDYAAGAVLIAAITAVVIGGLVFIPEIIDLIRKILSAI